MTVALDAADLLAEAEGIIRACAEKGQEPPREVVRALASLQRAVNAKKQLIAQRPLAFADLWVPECPTCPHPLNPTPPPEGRRGQPMEWIGPGPIHRCPECLRTEARTSQRLVVELALSNGIETTYLLGGNRCGKTEVGAMLSVVNALGARHPDVIAWRKRNGLSLRNIADVSRTVWSVAQTYSMSRSICREKLDRYFPGVQGVRRKNWDAENEAEISLQTDWGNAKIVCKAFSQGASEKTGKNPFEGAAIGFAWLDEEPPSVKAVESIQARTIDFGGRVLQTFTALTGWTPYLRSTLGFVETGRPTPEGVAVQYLHGVDNPHVSAAIIRRKFSHLPKSVQDARLYGKIVAVEGAVHEAFTRDLYVIPSFDPPPEWPRMRSIDWGSRAPFACTWLAYDAGEDQIHVFHEVYAAGLLLRESAQRIWAFDGCPECQPSEFATDDWMRWRVRIAEGLHQCDKCGGTGWAHAEPSLTLADPEGRDQRMTYGADFDIQTSPAYKARTSTFDELFRRMKPSRTGKPGLVFHDCCVETIREFEQLVWDVMVKTDYATKNPDHAHDTVRYAVWEFKRRGYTATPDPIEPENEGS